MPCSNKKISNVVIYIKKPRVMLALWSIVSKLSKQAVHHILATCKQDSFTTDGFWTFLEFHCHLRRGESIIFFPQYYCLPRHHRWHTPTDAGLPRLLKIPFCAVWAKQPELWALSNMCLVSSLPKTHLLKVMPNWSQGFSPVWHNRHAILFYISLKAEIKKLE